MGIEIEAFVIALEDDVDGAGDGVRPVNRRAADRDRFDAVNQLGVDRVQIDLGTGVGWAEDARGIRTDEAATVDQRQRSLIAETEKVDERLARPERPALVGTDRR